MIRREGGRGEGDEGTYVLSNHHRRSLISQLAVS